MILLSQTQGHCSTRGHLEWQRNAQSLPGPPVLMPAVKPLPRTSRTRPPIQRQVTWKFQTRNTWQFIRREPSGEGGRRNGYGPPAVPNGTPPPQEGRSPPPAGRPPAGRSPTPAGPARSPPPAGRAPPPAGDSPPSAGRSPPPGIYFVAVCTVNWNLTQKLLLMAIVKCIHKLVGVASTKVLLAVDDCG